MNNTLSVGSFITFGWETFKKRGWFLVGTTFLYLVLETVGRSINVGHNIFVSLIMFAISIFIGLGWTAFTLKAHDDITAVTISDLWHPKLFWQYFGVTILEILIIGIGLLLFIIPGIIAMAAFMFAPYFVVDKGMGPIEALKASARITKGNRLRVLALIGATILVTLLGCLALGVGLLVAIPVTALATVHTYRRLSSAADTNEVHQSLSGGEIVLLVIGSLVPMIAIIGIVAAVVLASLTTAREKGMDVYTNSNVHILQADLEIYNAMHNSYPSTLNDLIANSDPQLTRGITPDQYTYTLLNSGADYRLCSNATASVHEVCVSSLDTATPTTP